MLYIILGVIAFILYKILAEQQKSNVISAIQDPSTRLPTMKQLLINRISKEIVDEFGPFQPGKEYEEFKEYAASLEENILNAESEDELNKIFADYEDRKRISAILREKGNAAS